MYQFTATPDPHHTRGLEYFQSQTYPVQESGWNQNFQIPQHIIKHECQPSYQQAATHKDWPQQTEVVINGPHGGVPFQDTPQIVAKRDPYAQEGQEIDYPQQLPSNPSALPDHDISTQNGLHRVNPFQPPSHDGNSTDHIEQPFSGPPSLTVTYPSAGITYGDNRRKKPARVSQACTRCRDLKSKCCDEKPCKTCVENGVQCDFTIEEPKKADEKEISKISARLEGLEDLLQQVLTHVKTPPKTFNTIHPLEFEPAKKWKEENIGRVSQQIFPTPSSGKSLYALENGDSTLPEYGPAIPLDHTTAASEILSWTFVKNIIGDTLPEDRFDYKTTREANLDSARYGNTGAESNRGFHNAGLDLCISTASRLVNLYMERFNIIHTILFPDRVKTFSSFIAPSNGANSMLKSDKGMARQLKRKRSVELGEASNSGLTGSSIPQPSIEYALFLLVLSLGKICDHEEKLPHTFYGAGEQSSGSTSIRNGYPSPEEVDRSWSVQHAPANGDPPCRLRNMGVTPGAEYFAAATDMVGKLDGEDSLCYVQVKILASLYHKQLGQFSKCHATINEAARALQVILRRKITLSHHTKWDNAHLFAFWTCLMVESEIIAELPLPKSGLSTWEQFMPWPNAEQSERDLKSKAHIDVYLTQLTVRKHLNTIRAELYQQGHQRKFYNVPLNGQAGVSDLHIVIDDLNLCLSKISLLLPSEAKDPNPATILATRLTAKILAAQAIALRPYLMMVLNREGAKADISDKVKRDAKLCIETLERSATAFSKVKDDELVTYTQWGNAIILLAAFSDAFLRQFVHCELLRDLVNQSLGSLTQIAELSPALQQRYARALEVMARYAGLNEQYS